MMDVLMRLAKKAEGVVAFAIATSLYLPFLSRHFDLNGIAEARSLELGALFSPNHLLYRPLGLLVQDLLAAVGVPVRSIFVLQAITAVSAAAGVAFAYLFFKKLAGSRMVAAAGALWLGTTWAYWAYSTDAIYIPVAAMFAGAALASL